MERAYQRSAELLAEAGTAANEKQYQMANDLLKRATAELGDYYLQLPTPPTLDDSGMHLVLADDAERRGDLSMSISISSEDFIPRHASRPLAFSGNQIHGRNTRGRTLAEGIASAQIK
jgi:hypothetical protein